MKKTHFVDTGILQSLKPNISTSVAKYLKTNKEASSQLVGIIKTAVTKDLFSQCREKGLSQAAFVQCKSFAEETTVPGIIKQLRGLLLKPVPVIAVGLSTTGSSDPSKNLYGILSKSVGPAIVYRVKKVECKYPSSCTSDHLITESFTQSGYNVSGAPRDSLTNEPVLGTQCDNTNDNTPTSPPNRPSPSPAGGIDGFRHWVNKWLESAVGPSPCPQSSTPIVPGAPPAANAQQQYALNYGLCAKLNSKCLNRVKYKDNSYYGLSECEESDALFSYN